MAGYDPEDGCPCGLRYECDRNCETSKFEGLIQMAKAKESVNPAPNHNLREIAGRIKKLPYTDMMILGEAVRLNLPSEGSMVPMECVDALLQAADALEHA